MKIFTSILYIGSLILFTGCKKYLEEEPLKQVTIQTADQLEALINNATAFTYDGNNATAAYSTDDTEITLDQYANNESKFGIENLYYYVFNVEQIVGLAADPLWNGEYKKIFTANLVLNNVDKVTGSESLKSQLKADAHFIRAFSYWTLVNHYCQPYSQENLSSPGLPLKKTLDYEESLQRSSLKETYEFILADVTEAMKTQLDDVDPKRPWRISKKAVEAFLSRYYLFTNDYDKSLEYANKALMSSTAVLVNFNTINAGIAQTYSNPAAKIEYSELNDWQAVKFIYWKEFYYPRFTYTSSQWFIPSSSLISLYDKTNDLRYKWFMMENGGRRFTVITPQMYRYTMFFDGRYLPTGPTIAEMLLNKAEILARKDMPDEAMNALNLLREKRFITPAPLTSDNKTDAINKVLEERRREMPFAMRWFDIRRFSVNDYAQDDVTVTHTFYKVGVGTVDKTKTENYTLPVGSKRYAVPINGVEMDAAQGQLEQNKY